jgi:hypothetical protein
MRLKMLGNDLVEQTVHDAPRRRLRKSRNSVKAKTAWG